MVVTSSGPPPASLATSLASSSRSLCRVPKLVPRATDSLAGGSVCGAGTVLAIQEKSGEGAETPLAELELGGGAKPELSDGADPELGDEIDLELGSGMETELDKLGLGGEAGPELGGGHSTGLLDHPSTELLRVEEELVLAVVPRTQSSRCSCLPPILSSVWRRP